MIGIKRLPLTNKPVVITWVFFLGLISGLISGCEPQTGSLSSASPEAQVPFGTDVSSVFESEVTPLPTRPAYSPGELVDYVVQSGDTLPALASHFNTTIAEVREANPIIPEDVTTLPPGMPMKIPIYYAPLWGTSYQILPDSQFVDGPAQMDFDTQAFLEDKPGWLKSYVAYASGDNRNGAEIINLVAENFSVSPRLLLALLEYQLGGVSQPVLPENVDQYVLGNNDRRHRGFYLQLVWAANTLNNAYYAWRSGDLRPITHLDGTLERPDPWQNAGTVALQNYFSLLLTPEEYTKAVGGEGFAATYKSLFGDPWENQQEFPHYLHPQPNWQE